MGTSPLMLLALAACASKPPELPREAVPVQAAAPPPPAAVPAAADVVRCGGIAGLRCPLPLVCIDDPDDTCVPGRGADCIGRCVASEEAPSRPGVRRPVSDDPEACKRLRFRCEPGEMPYSDASGCGCEVGGAQPL